MHNIGSEYAVTPDTDTRYRDGGPSFLMYSTHASGRPVPLGRPGEVREVLGADLPDLTSIGWVLVAMFHRDMFVRHVSADAYDRIGGDGRKTEPLPTPQVVRVPVYLVKAPDDHSISAAAAEVKKLQESEASLRAKLADKNSELAGMKKCLEEVESQRRILAEEVTRADKRLGELEDRVHKGEFVLDQLRRERNILRDEIGHGPADRLLKQKLGKDPMAPASGRKCADCDRINASDHLFCSGCGSEMSDDEDDYT